LESVRVRPAHEAVTNDADVQIFHSDSPRRKSVCTSASKRKPRSGRGTHHPAQLGRRSPRIGPYLVRGSPNHISRHLGINAFAFPSLKRLLHPAIFSGMKRQNGSTSARFEALGKMTQKCIERGELVVHSDAQGLEHT